MVAYRIQAGAVDGTQAGDTRKKVLDRAEPRRAGECGAGTRLAGSSNELLMWKLL